ADAPSERGDDESDEAEPEGRDDPRNEPQVRDSPEPAEERGDVAHDPCEDRGESLYGGRAAALGSAEHFTEAGVGRGRIDGARGRAVGRGDVRVEDRERAIRAIRAREDVGDPTVVDRDRIPSGLDGGRLSEECRGLREQTV